MSLLDAIEEFQDSRYVKAWLSQKKRLIECLLQRAEGLIEGWGDHERIGEGLAAVRETGIALMLGLSQDEGFAYEVRAMRALRKLFREESPRDLPGLSAGLDDCLDLDGHLKHPLR